MDGALHDVDVCTHTRFDLFACINSGSASVVALHFLLDMNAYFCIQSCRFRLRQAMGAFNRAVVYRMKVR